MKSITRKLTGAAAAAMAVTMLFAGCSTNTPESSEAEEETEETTVEESSEDAEDAEDTEYETSADTSQAPSQIPFDYKIVPAASSEGTDDRGYYVFERPEDALPYKLVIAAGEFSTGGYDIEITDVLYDGTELVVTVKETAPADTDMVTEAFTYPCCAMELGLLPDEIRVVSESGQEFECLDISLDEGEIEDGWLCVLEDGAGEFMRKTYVYENADGTYKYINVESTTTSWGASTWNDVVKGSGTADTRDDIVAAAEDFGSCGFVLLPNDYQTVYTIDEFTAGKAF